jgi:hypothetical protein
VKSSSATTRTKTDERKKAARLIAGRSRRNSSSDR